MIEAPAAWRQSYIAQFDRCPLSLRFSMESRLHQPSWLAARGTLAHRFFARSLEFMREHGEAQIPVDVAMELLAEVIAQRDVPDEEVVHLPMRELRWLRVLATKFAYGHSYSVDRVVDVERRLSATIPVRGPDGAVYQREITGQPDVLLASPPDGAEVVDYKTGWSPAPRKYEDDEAGEASDDRLSDMGYAQQIIYGFLVLSNYPAVESVALREYYVMTDEVRVATVHRWEMERIQDVLSALVSQMDAAVAGGPDSRRWIPVPGTHCSMCARPRDCPIRQEVGIPTSEAEAQRLAHEWIVAGAVRTERLPYLKGWVDAHGSIPVAHAKGRRAVGWVRNKTGTGRSFRLHAPEGASASPFDELLVEAARSRGALV